MQSLYWIAGALLTAVWLPRFIESVIGMRKVADITAPQWDVMPEGSPTLLVVTPSRNEEAGVEAALHSLLHSDYPHCEIVAVNDRSTDRTASIMRRVEAERLPGTRRLRIIDVVELPPGWLGKVHAMWLGAQQSESDWILFTDGDVMHQPQTLRRALACAEQSHADHVVLNPTLLMETAGERMMIGFFHTVILLVVRPWKVPDPKAWDHVGAGAFNMVRRSAYEAVGTYQSMRLEVIDDVKLGQAIKRAGFRSQAIYGYGMVSVRWAKGAMGIVNTLTKNSFAALGFSVGLVIAALLGLVFVQLLPWVGVVAAPGWSKIGYAIALATIFAAYVTTSRESGVPPVYFFFHPVATVLCAFALLKSTFLTLLQGGVVWRGTLYPLKELKQRNKTAPKG